MEAQRTLEFVNFSEISEINVSPNLWLHGKIKETETTDHIDSYAQAEYHSQSKFNPCTYAQNSTFHHSVILPPNPHISTEKTVDVALMWLRGEINLLYREFCSLAFPKLQPFPRMNSRKIATFTNKSHDYGKKSNSTPDHRELNDFKSFSHGLEILVNDREDRYFRASKVYIQGLPLNPGQAMEVARHVCDLNGLPIADATITALGRHIKSLNNHKGNSTKGESAIPMIGSTALSHAVVLDLVTSVDFSASPAIDSFVPTVMEVVVRTTSDLKEAAPTTVTIVPWLIEETTDLALYFSFHHMAMDAKPEIVHAIYQELAVASNKQSDSIQQLQFIVRIITAEKPMWVIDIVGNHEQTLNGKRCR
jgi:hypothetical protein